MRHQERSKCFCAKLFGFSFRISDLLDHSIHHHSSMQFARALIMDRQKYIQILKQEFQHRRGSNHVYSLRDFAKDINLNYSHLSYVLNAQRGLSRKKAEFVARKLSHLNFAQRQEFLLIVSSISARSRFARNLARMGLRNNASGLQKRFNLIAQDPK